jgi:DNA-binding response OmpR family regulator/anti-sigma regulatory factor (Ser/Thr protein kinase)
MSEASGTIIVVDDTPSKRYILSSWLRRGGYTVIEAATGAEALARFREGGVDLVVLDVRLPDMSGFEVCEQIKADPGRPTPVIHVSAAAIHAMDRTHGLQRGADAYLVEPIEPGELLATVAAIMRYYQARIQAEMLAGRLTSLARVSATLGATNSEAALLREAATGAATIFQAPVAIIAAATDGARLTASSSGPGAGAVLGPSMMEFGDEPIGIAYHDRPARDWPQTSWPDVDTVRVLTVRPRRDRPALYVVVPTGATLDGAPVLTLFGQAVMSAMDAVRLYHDEHDLALTLQRSLLPSRLPHVPGFELAVRYVPAGDRAEIGGDFYEAARFGDQLMIAVGDVGGHSLHAATIMAELRHATRAYLVEGHGPAAVVDRLNRLMAELIPDETATLCLLSIDLTSGLARLANAGHPPPLINTASGVRPIVGHSPLLGIRGRPATEIEFTLEPDDTLLLYTDGLIELRTEVFDESFARLTHAAATIEPDLEAFASRMLADVGPAEPSDDIALVVVRRHAVRTGNPPGRPDVRPPDLPPHPVDRESLTAIRHAVTAHAQGRGLTEQGVNDLVLIANELAANVVLHGGGTGRLWLWSTDGMVYCEVSDEGPGLPDPERAGTVPVDPHTVTGRGLWLIRQMSDRVHIDSGPRGTTITVGMRLGR